MGEKSEDVALTKIETVQVGDVTVKNQVFAVYPLASFENVEDVPQSGLIGYEFFKRFVVRIDYEASRLTFTEPAVFKYQGKGAVVPFTYNNHIPQVEGRFNVTFDYSRQTIVFEPNARNAEPDVYDRSGMWLNRKGPGFEVIDVLSGGPAEQAALRPGDLILAVDGKGADGLWLPDVRSRFRSESPGTRIRLSVRSGDTTREVVLTLKELV